MHIHVPFVMLNGFGSQNNGWLKMSVQVTSSLNQATAVGKHFVIGIHVPPVVQCKFPRNGTACLK